MRENITKETSKRAVSTLKAAGIPEDHAEIAAELLWKFYLEEFKASKWPLSAVEDVRRGCGHKHLFEPEIRAEVKVFDNNMPGFRRQRKKWGVQLFVNDQPYQITFDCKDQTLIYICTLMRNKIGEKLYHHEFFNNSKGKTSKLKQKNTARWTRAVYNTLFPGNVSDFDTWINNIERAHGRPLHQGKSQANRTIKGDLASEPDTVVHHCVIDTRHDTNGDSYYNVDIDADSITLPESLERLVDDFYEIVGIAPSA